MALKAQILHEKTLLQVDLWYSAFEKGIGFPGGSVVKNPPANAGDTGSSPGPGRSHMPRISWARAPQLLSLCSRAREPQLLKPVCYIY